MSSSLVLYVTRVGNAGQGECPRPLDEISLQTAAADGASVQAVLGDQQMRPGPPVGGALDLDHGRQEGLGAALFGLGRGGDDALKFLHG